MNGSGEDHRREEQDARRARPFGPSPRACSSDDVQADDQVGRREGVEVERSEERGEQPGQRTPQRPSADRRDHEQHDRDEPRQPERRRPMRQETRPEDRGDPEERPVVRPRVVVRVVGSRGHDDRRPTPATTSPIEPDPAHPATGDDQDRGDRRDPSIAGQAHGERPHDQGQDPGHAARSSPKKTRDDGRARTRSP